MTKEVARTRARQLAHEFLQRGDATGWFEALYAQAEGEAEAIQWADLVVNPNLLGWLTHHNVVGNGRKALVIGSGLGDDAEELAGRGCAVVACDISPTAIAWSQKRFATSQVDYVVADVLTPPDNWRRAFDFVLEAYTLQVLPPGVRTQAIAQIASFVAPGGSLLVIARGREDGEQQGNMPWPLTRGELEQFQRDGLQEVLFEDYLEAEEPPVRRFRVQYSRVS